MPNVEKPPRPVAPDYQPKNANAITVHERHTWSTLAHDLSISPWDLIDFNFPGIKQTYTKNFQLATRHVNWYLKEYIGCSAANGPNYKFSTAIKGGQGAHKNGTIFLPRKPYVPPPEPACVEIEIPPISLPWQAQLVLNQAGITLPKRARCLDPVKEIPEAKKVFKSSLNYHLIYIADGSSSDDRACTVAVPFDGVWIVLLNVGSSGYQNHGSDYNELIHELVHAWQSQHHPQPWQYMVNCLGSQAAAKVASVASDPFINNGINIISPVNIPVISEADAYSYVPGKNFGDYAGEQIAQQVEDHYKKFHKVSATARPKLEKIVNHVSSVPAGKPDPENVKSLSTIRYAYEIEKDVVWHD